MGRPLQPPTIKPLYRADGTVRGYLVSATVGGKQRKKIRRTMDQAKDLAAKWQGCRDESIQHLPTTLTIPKLRDAEAADAFWESLGLTATKAAAWMVQHYKKPADGTWNDLIEEFRQARRLKHRLKEGAPDTPHLVNLFAAARGFAAHTGRPNVGNPTQDEVESFMKTRGGFNQLLGDLRSLCIWAVKRGKMPSDPTLAIERQIRVRGKIPTTLRPEQVAYMLHTLESEAPEWIPYAAVCTFAFVRPYTREGEAQRMDADLRQGRQVVLKDGLFVSLSKNGKPRVIPWQLTGPLRQWLMAYPIRYGSIHAEEFTKVVGGKSVFSEQEFHGLDSAKASKWKKLHSLAEMNDMQVGAAREAQAIDLLLAEWFDEGMVVVAPDGVLLGKGFVDNLAHVAAGFPDQAALLKVQAESIGYYADPVNSRSPAKEPGRKLAAKAPAEKTACRDITRD